MKLSGVPVGGIDYDMSRVSSRGVRTDRKRKRGGKRKGGLRHAWTVAALE